MSTLATRVSRALDLPLRGVEAVLKLLEEGATVPFVARYRKEATGGLDEVQIRAIALEAERVEALEKRREAILASLSERGLLTDALSLALRAAATKAVLEDLYAPFKQTRRTRAQVARERGLADLAEFLWQGTGEAPEVRAKRFVEPAREVPDVAAALAGARDICAERLATDPAIRTTTRETYFRRAALSVDKTPKHRAATTKFDTQLGGLPRLGNIPSHRWLALCRGEHEGVLRLKFEFDATDLERNAVRSLPRAGHPQAAMQREQWVGDAFQRLLVPAAKSEARRALDEAAEATAVEVFAKNLRDLLLAPPLGARTVLGIDPGQRTGCKCALVDQTGKLLAIDTLFLVQGKEEESRAQQKLKVLLKKADVFAIAVGNGTHGRETERFVKGVLGAMEFPGEAPLCVSVGESGASVYSASDVARREFPDLDVSYRGAVNIARRLQDPLAELVKIDPRSIGVGQYQHDLDATRLSKRLTEVVESCVNSVGVDLNTASPELLAYVSGLGPKLAERIVEYRHERGRFDDRQQLLAVKGLGAKAFEQAAGFLRIAGGKNPLDATAVHPESYPVVQAIAQGLKASVAQLLNEPKLLDSVNASEFSSVGEYTLKDILDELSRPGRDPRQRFEPPQFADGIDSIEAVKVGMKLSGVVTNVAAFGAFVDIGVHQDGLIHVSKLAKGFVRDPSALVKVGESVQVEVLEVDLPRRRIGLARL